MSLHKSRNIQPSKILLYKHLLSKISQNLKTKQSGFTLIELLVSMVILTVVVGMTGTGLVFVMSKNTSSDGEITQQANLRRALDFIGDEIRSASVVSQAQPTTDTAWTPIPSAPASSTASSSILYLEIPTPVDSINTTDKRTLKIPNHGLVQGNAVKVSGTGLPTGITKDTTYYVSSVSSTLANTPPDLLQLVPSTTGGTPITFNTTPQNFAIRRLVLYYPAAYVDNSGWKGQQVLYRATGNCTTADRSNCLVMVDSLVNLPTLPTPLSKTDSPFFSELVGSKQATISLNGKLCNPPTPENSCATTVNNKVSVSLTAISRATLK